MLTVVYTLYIMIDSFMFYSHAVHCENILPLFYVSQAAQIIFRALNYRSDDGLSLHFVKSLCLLAFHSV